jgi:hypothetical protein
VGRVCSEKRNVDGVARGIHYMLLNVEVDTIEQSALQMGVDEAKGGDDNIEMKDGVEMSNSGHHGAVV